MKKPISTFVKLIIFIIVTQFTNAQSKASFAKFSVAPDKRICSLDLERTNFFVEYKSKKKATISIDLIKGGKLYATTKKTIKSKDRSITKLNFEKKPNLKITPGNGYSLKLSMYEGDTNIPKKIVTQIIVDDIQLSRLFYSKI